MNRKLLIFVVRWLLNSLGLWIAVRLLGSGYSNVDINVGIFGFLIAGLIFSVVNSALRPLAIVLSLPAILFSLGLFMLIINGLMVYISLNISPGISMTFSNSIITGLLMSLINYIVTTVFSIQGEIK